MAASFIYSAILFAFAVLLGIWLGVNNPEMFAWLITPGFSLSTVKLPSEPIATVTPKPPMLPGEGGAGLPPVTMPGEGGSGLPPPESTTEVTVPASATGAQGSSGNGLPTGEKAPGTSIA